MASHWPSPVTTTTPAKPAHAPVAPTTTSGIALAAATGPGWLAPGSDPSVLPGPILITDGDGNRVLIIDSNGRTMWTFPGAGDLAAGQTFKAPEAAWFSPDQKQIVAVSEDTHILYVIDIATHKIVYTYGKAGVPGSGPNLLNRPDGVVMLPSREVWLPDAGNCRIIMLSPGGQSIARQLGQTGNCVHNPPQTFDDPAGLFPMSNGNYLLTEGHGRWVSEMSLAGSVKWSVQVPGVSAIYATSEAGPDRYVTVDHVLPGQVLTFDHTGRVLWRYAPTGAQTLNKPAMALALPNGDFMVSDKVNNRVIVVDPRTNKVVWQYGHTGVAGATPGFLNNPTGMDLYPPNSMFVKQPAK